MSEKRKAQDTNSQEVAGDDKKAKSTTAGAGDSEAVDASADATPTFENIEEDDEFQEFEVYGMLLYSITC